MKKKSHSLVIKVRFDRPVTERDALVELRDAIHGDFYPDEYRCGAGKMSVRSFCSTRWIVKAILAKKGRAK